MPPTGHGSRRRSRPCGRAQRADERPALLLVRALGEHLLELVDDQHQPRGRSDPARARVGGLVRRGGGAISRVAGSVQVDDEGGPAPGPAGLCLAPGVGEQSLADRRGDPGRVGAQVRVQCPGGDAGQGRDPGGQFQQRTPPRGQQVQRPRLGSPHRQPSGRDRRQQAGPQQRGLPRAGRAEHHQQSRPGELLSQPGDQGSGRLLAAEEPAGIRRPERRQPRVGAFQADRYPGGLQRGGAFLIRGRLSDLGQAARAATGAHRAGLLPQDRQLHQRPLLSLQHGPGAGRDLGLRLGDAA